MARAGASLMLSSEVIRARQLLGKLLWALGVTAAIAALAAGWLFQRARQRTRALDAAARGYVEWIRAGDARASVELGAERRFARALGLPGATPARDSDTGHALRETLAARLTASKLEPAIDPSELGLDDVSWRCDHASGCTRQDARKLARALGRLDRALAVRRAALHLQASALELGGAAPPPLARPVPIRGSDLIVSWLGTNEWGHLLRSRPPHVLDFPDGHHLALQTQGGSIWATTWSDAVPPRGPHRVAQVPLVECGHTLPLASDRPQARCSEVAITAMVATRGGRVAVKLLRTDVDFVSELLLASADYGRTWQPGKPRAIR